MTPQPYSQPPPQPQPQNTKTVLGVVLLLLFGGLACCGLFMAFGAYTAYNEQKAKLGGKFSFDGGSKTASVDDDDFTPTSDDDDDAPPPVNVPRTEDQELRERFAQEMISQLEIDGHPGFSFDRKRFRLANNGGEQIELGNLYEEYQARDDDERLDFVENFSKSYGAADLPESWNAAKGQVLVTVRDRITMELLPVRAPDAQMPVSKKLADDLLEVVVYDGPNKMQYLTPDDLKAWGIDEEEAFLEGKKQLAARSAKKGFTSPSEGVWESQWADNHDVGRALLTETIRRLKVKGDPIVFLPQRDHLIVTGTKDVDGQEAAAELVDQYLELPRANSGRGWVVTASGFTPWIPPKNSRFAELRMQATAGDANEQKKAFDEKFDKDGTDIFVGTTLFTEDDDGKQFTYAVWTKGADTLMPRADFIVLVDIDRPEPDRVIAAAPWDTVVKIAGSKMKADTSYWPLRYRLKTFPDAKQVKAIGLHHFFTRNKGGKDATDGEDESDESEGD
ncbi:MAG: hypothetical protein JNM17_12415 [Archangium sp.]|nr:hypothetical protein [Archangium sp.]